MRRPARPSSQEINRAILEAAAEVFARRGFAATTLQMVADTVGYSKTGLLRRFPSKQTLYDAVLTETIRLVGEEILGSVATPPVRMRDRPALWALLIVAVAHPGHVLLVLEAGRPGHDLPRAADLQSASTAVLDQLATNARDTAGRLRAILAAQLVVNAALLTVHADVAPELRLPDHELRELVLGLANQVLGDPAPAPEPH